MEQEILETIQSSPISHEAAIKLIDFSFFIELLPIFILGFLLGMANYYIARDKAQEEALEKGEQLKSHAKPLKRSIVSGVESCVICFLAYCALEYFTALSYPLRLGISCAVAFFGIDKALDYVQKLLNLVRATK